MHKLKQQLRALRNIDLNFRGPGPEAEELIADTAWTSAAHQRDVQRLWEFCSGARVLKISCRSVFSRFLAKRKRNLAVGRSD